MEIKELKADDLSVIRMGDRRYLGVILEDGVTIEHLKYCEKGFDKTDIEDWFKKLNIETLETMTLSVGQGIRSRKLNPAERRYFNLTKERFLQAKGLALNYWENEVFDKID